MTRSRALGCVVCLGADQIEQLGLKTEILLGGQPGHRDR